MQTCLTDFDRLSLLVRRLLDAEFLLEEEGAALLAESDAACLCFAAGEAEATRRHIERLAQFTAALVATNALACTDGQAVLQFADALLNPRADGKP
jgi:hypothetical protein